MTQSGGKPRKTRILNVRVTDTFVLKFETAVEKSIYIRQSDAMRALLEAFVDGRTIITPK